MIFTTLVAAAASSYVNIQPLERPMLHSQLSLICSWSSDIDEDEVIINAKLNTNKAGKVMIF